MECKDYKEIVRRWGSPSIGFAVFFGKANFVGLNKA
jgi:hypothetical protein